MKIKIPIRHVLSTFKCDLMRLVRDITMGRDDAFEICAGLQIVEVIKTVRTVGGGHQIMVGVQKIDLHTVNTYAPNRNMPTKMNGLIETLINCAEPPVLDDDIFNDQTSRAIHSPLIR